MINFMATRSIRKTAQSEEYLLRMLRSEAKLRQCTPIKDNVLAQGSLSEVPDLVAQMEAFFS
jgi:hypothetical protein